MMNALIVEDDDFKASDLIRLIEEILPAANLKKALSVTSALRAISEEKFDLVFLDMSLPTFDLAGPGGGGSPQGQGGIEVLRLAKRLNYKTSYLVVTQYPDIEIDGRDVPLSLAGKALSTRFDADVLSCIRYEFDGDSWKQHLRRALTKPQ